MGKSLKLPDGIRLAGPEDLERVWRLCEIGHADNGAFPLAPSKVIGLLKRALWGRGNPPAVIGVIDGPERIEAAVCLDSIQHWYSDTWFYTDRFLYVHPLHRKSRHAFRLLRFCRWWYEANGCSTPIVISIETMNDRESKERLYQRYARRVGASFVIGTMPAEDELTCARAATQ